MRRSGRQRNSHAIGRVCVHARACASACISDSPRAFNQPLSGPDQAAVLEMCRHDSKIRICRRFTIYPKERSSKNSPKRHWHTSTVPPSRQVRLSLRDSTSFWLFCEYGPPIALVRRCRASVLPLHPGSVVMAGWHPPPRLFRKFSVIRDFLRALLQS